MIAKLIMDERHEYYFITVFERLGVDENGLTDTGRTRCWGFYTDKETAFQELHENWTDMWETIYSYAVIEGYCEGISQYTGYRQFFKYDREKDGYFESAEPKGYEHYCSFGIG